MIAEKLTALLSGLELSPEGAVLAEVAQNMAAMLDDRDVAAYVKPSIARQLRETLTALHDLAPVQIRPVSDSELAAVLGAWTDS